MTRIQLYRLANQPANLHKAHPRLSFFPALRPPNCLHDLLKSFLVTPFDDFGKYRVVYLDRQIGGISECSAIDDAPCPDGCLEKSLCGGHLGEGFLDAGSIGGLEDEVEGRVLLDVFEPFGSADRNADWNARKRTKGLLSY